MTIAATAILSVEKRPTAQEKGTQQGSGKREKMRRQIKRGYLSVHVCVFLL